MSDATPGKGPHGPGPRPRRLAGLLRVTRGRRGDNVPEADATPAGDTVLWHLRTTVRDDPGSLGRLCLALAARQVDILTLQTHPLADGTVDEFLLRAPAVLRAAGLEHAVTRGGGRDTRVERADAHDLVDAPVRALGVATRTALAPAELPLALRDLLGRCTVDTWPAPSPGDTPHPGPAPAEGVLDGTRMRLRTADGGALAVERPCLPFTPTEFARARALVALGTALALREDRAPASSRSTAPPVVLDEAGPDDRQDALALHARCSAGTLALRYRGGATEADAYLPHLLDPRFGRALAAREASGRIVALGHLLWDGGEEAEVALLVEDGWQRRGVGSALLDRLVEFAVDAGCADVYAVTQTSNTGMAAAMRSLGLPLGYQVEDGTLVITARLDRSRATTGERT